MSSIYTSDTTFLTSSFNPPVHGFFQGYCFVGVDLIYGAVGAKEYQDATGQVVPPSQDGCYVAISQEQGAFIFDVDFAGYKVLYYYHDGEAWVVSDSFAQVVDFLRAYSLPVRPNYAHLAAIGGKGMASGQLFSLQTLVHGIRVAPRTHRLIITPNRAILKRRPDLASHQRDYTGALSEYLNNWVSRFETLMMAEMTDFTVDLTGGVDSRANFALVQAARRRLGESGTPPRLNSGATPTNQLDLEIAQAVAGHFQLEVNDKRKIDRRPLVGDESYKAYRNHAMGVYYPFYMPKQGPTLSNISISGGGGGVHRKIYELHAGSKDVHNFFKRNAEGFKRPEYEMEFIQDGRSFLDQVLDEGEDPLRVLLRDGRVRYHSGRTPRYVVAFTPLHSVWADRTQALAGYKRIEEGQFNYDIMHSLEPELVTMPYDTNNKFPSELILARLTGTPISALANPGRVWATEMSPTRPGQTSQKARLDAYKSSFDKATDNPFVINFWGQEIIAVAQERMNALVAGESIGNAVQGKPISAVYAADLVSPI